MEIGPRNANLLRDIASARGLSVEEVLNEVLVFYLRFYDQVGESGLPEPRPPEPSLPEPGLPEPNLGPSTAETYRALFGWMDDAERRRFSALLDRMASRFDFEDPDEAMRIAIEEQRAFRSERADRERERSER